MILKNIQEVFAGTFELYNTYVSITQATAKTS